jgi:hypothetical protein
MNRPMTVPEVHTGGGEFRLDIVDDEAPANEKRWRIVLKNHVFQLVLIDDAKSVHNCLSIERTGAQPNVIRGGEQL